MCGCYRTIIFHAQLNANNRPGCRSCSSKYILTRHSHLYRSASFLGEQNSERLKISNKLAAKPTAYFTRHKGDIRHILLQKARDCCSKFEVALSTTPNRALACFINVRYTSVRLYISLVHHWYFVFAFDNKICLSKAGLKISSFKPRNVRQITWILRFFWQVGVVFLVDQHRFFRHRGHHI